MTTEPPSPGEVLPHFPLPPAENGAPPSETEAPMPTPTPEATLATSGLTEAIGTTNHDTASDQPDTPLPDGMGLLLRDMGTVNPLTESDERQIAQAIEAGKAAAARLLLEDTDSPLSATDRLELHRAVRDGEEARRKFIQSNVPLVINRAKRYKRPPGMELRDSINNGMMGLIRSVDRFDWRMGYKLSTFAEKRIRQAITRGIVDYSRAGMFSRKAGEELRKALAEADSDPEELDEALQEYYRVMVTLSLDSEKGNAHATAITPSFENKADAKLLAIALLAHLDPQTRYIMGLRFGFIDGTEYSFTEIGDEMGVHRDVIRRLVNRTLKSLQEIAGQQG